VPVGYEEFRDALIARHQNPVTSALSTAGDVLLLAAVPAGVATRSPRAAAGCFVAGYAVAVVAHLFQPGTVADEVVSVFRHPVWSTRAETVRVRAQLTRR
jgi:hypothetical protein